MSVHIGTSGWSYDHWVDILYPRKASSLGRLDAYARRFRTVEVNNTFYRWPKDEVFAAWHARLPERFEGSVSSAASVQSFDQYGTHGVYPAFQLGARSLAWQATAQGPGGQGPKTTLPFQVKLLTPDSELQLAVADKIEVNQGSKFKFTVKVSRGAFRGPVRVQFTGVPSGAFSLQGHCTEPSSSSLA